MPENLQDNIKSIINQVQKEHDEMAMLKKLMLVRYAPKLDENLERLEMLKNILTNILKGEDFLLYLLADEYSEPSTKLFRVVQIRLKQKNHSYEKSDIVNNQQEPGVDY